MELATKTKIFCGCSTAFGRPPNVNTCPVCTGMPGALPVLNKKVVEYALAVGLALNCQINRFCRFDRKNYFYPDNPQNYQISQLYLPLCHDGFLKIGEGQLEKKIHIHEIHMEEDAGKLIHNKGGFSLVDYNRSGVPLIEIVSEPDMRNAQEVIAYLEKLQVTLQYLGVSDCKIQEGSMRVDVNLSVREAGEKRLGTRTEMKNLSSFKAISQAVEEEKNRQIALLEAGKAVVQETRRWDEGRGISFSMRAKEDARDYRYFPEPDLPPVNIPVTWIKRLQEQCPEMREEKAARYQQEFGLPVYDAMLLTENRHIAEVFEEAAAICHKPKAVSNWLMGEGMRLLKEQGKDGDQMSFPPKYLARLIDLVDSKVINRIAAKEVFEQIFIFQVNPDVYIEEKGLRTVQDENTLREAVQQVIAANPQSLRDYQQGKKKAAGFLVGQAMKAMEGKADPGAVNRLVDELLQRLCHK